MNKISWLFLLTTVALNASASLLVKKGATALVGGQKVGGGIQGMLVNFLPAINVYTIVGIILLGLSFLTYIVVLSKVQLSIAQPMLAISYILVGVSAHFIFGEDLSPMKLIGIGVIILGVFLISRV